MIINLDKFCPDTDSKCLKADRGPLSRISFSGKNKVVEPQA